MKNLLLLFFFVIGNARNLSSQTTNQEIRTKDSLKIKSIYAEANRYLDINTDTARMYAINGINLSKKTKYDRGIANGYFYMALSYYTDNKYDSTIVYYQKSSFLFKKINARKANAVILNNLGETYVKNGKMDEAFSSYNTALLLFEQLGQKEGIARTCFNIGLVFKLNGNYKAATDYFFRSLQLSESIGDTVKISLTLQEIGSINLRQKRYAESLKYYSEALAIIQKNSSENLSIKAGLRCNLAIVYEQSGNFEKAEENYNETFSMYKKYQNKPGMANILLNLGELNNKRGHYDKALKFNVESYKISQQLNDPYSIAFTLYNRGSIYRGMKQYDKSLIISKDALNRAKKLKNMPLMKYIAEEMSIAYDTLRDYKNAYKYHKLLKTISDSLSNDEITRKITTLELQYEFDKKQKIAEFAQKQREIIYEARLKRQRIMVKAFLLSASLLVLLLFTGFSYYRIKQKAKLRGLEIDLNRSIQQALSQQMNPHFIFNCLNSIKALILDKKVDDAEKYFGVFANLMRKNLEYSQYPAIPIKKEIETLKLYVELEQLRFKNMFEFNTIIDEEIDQLSYKIPSLLLQPFVENAIIHGIKNKTEEGSISLELVLNNNEIFCSIDDNGVGRQQPNENSTNKNHKSYGTLLTKRRLELIYQLYGNAHGLSIIDKKNPNGTAAGTRVEFGIPIIS